MVNIMHNFKTTSNSQKGQVVEGKVVREFIIEEHVYLKVKQRKISMKLRVCHKLAPKYYDPFEILARIRHVASELA